MTSSEDNTLGMLAHLLGIFTGFIGPLIIWLVKKDESPYVDHHGKQALNFQLTLLIGYLVSFVLVFVIIGVFLWGVVWVLGLVFAIMATIAATKGDLYRYPIAIPFIR